jgi:hypothetical protein
MILPVLIAIVDLFIKKPQHLDQPALGYFWPVLTADGKLDCAPK